MSKVNIIANQMDADTDRGKYWQYKLKQKEKTKKANDSKNTKIKVKTPEKSKKHTSILTQDNFFSSTIQKLKGLLQNTQQQKPKIMPTNSTKHSKEVITSRSQPYDVFKKCRQTEKETRNQSNSMVLLKREKKDAHQPLFRNEKQSPNKSRSRSKSLKYKIDRHKNQKNKVKQQKSLQLAKMSKKKNSAKTKQTKSTTRKFQTIVLPNLDEESKSWKKKLMQTMVIHRNISQQQDEELKYVSTFRVWQAHEQKQFNEKKKRTGIIYRYLKGFAVLSSYCKKKEVLSLRSSRNSRSSSSNFKDIVKSQEEKLLQLKQYLFNLKNSANIDESLELIITKVNQNIINLKNFQTQDKINQRRNKLTSVKSLQTTPLNKNYSLKVQPINSSFNNHKSSLNIQRQLQASNDHLIEANIHNAQEQTSLNYSNFQKSPLPIGYLSGRQSEPSFSLKQQSSSLLLDSKFLKIQILKTPAQKADLNSYPNKPQPHSSKQQTVEKISKHSITEQDMLLSASNEKNEEKAIEQNQIQPSVPIISQFSMKKELPIIKIEQEEQLNSEPIFKRSQTPPKNSTIGNSLNLCQGLNQTNQSLIQSLNQIVEAKGIQNDFSGFIQAGITIDQRNHIFEFIAEQLFIQTSQILNKLPTFKQKLISQHNNDIVEITEHNDEAIDLRSNQDQQTIIPISASDQYVLEIAEKVIREAYRHNLPQRISKALGVPSLVTLRCIRKLNAEQPQQDQTIELNQEDQDMIQQYTEVIDSQLYHDFEQNFSPAPDNPYQMVFNRCIYDTLNLLLDDYRPFGSKGMPGICFKSPKYSPPQVQELVLLLKGQLRRLTDIKMGLLQQRELSRLQIEGIVSKTLRLWKEDVIRYIQKQYNYKQEDDTIQRYELMLDIEQQLFSQEVMQLQLLMLNKQFSRFT